jgi:xanthine phosphoribosyltransferase
MDTSYTRDVFISWDEVHRDARELCQKLMGVRGRFEHIVAIARGGLIPAVIVARELNIRSMETVCASSYGGKEGQRQDEIIFSRMSTHDGTGCLVVDDLTDTGKTIIGVREFMPKALFSTLYVKPDGKPSVDFHVREVSQTTWIRFPWDTGLGYSVPLVERQPSVGLD